MIRSEIEANIKEAIALILGVGEDTIKSTDQFKDLGDSVDKVEIIMFVESEFGIDVSDAELNSLNTVEELVNLVWDTKLSGDK